MFRLEANPPKCGGLYTYFHTLYIARRCSRSGSLTTLLVLLMTIVARSLLSYAGQRGSFGVLGSPLLAKAIHASLTLSARAIASAPPPVSRSEILTLSNANGISMVC